MREPIEINDLLICILNYLVKFVLHTYFIKLVEFHIISSLTQLIYKFKV